MALQHILRATSVLSLLFSAHVVQASHVEEVDAVVYILSDLDDYLATPFCQDYIHYHEKTSTYIVTGAPITVTRTVAPTSCTETSVYPTSSITYPSPSVTPSEPSPYPPTKPSSSPITSSTPSSPTSTHSTPWISTISSTTTITYITTSTIYVGADPTPQIQIALKMRSANFLSQRDTWCFDYGVPCRLVVYTPNVIGEACGEFLGGGNVEWKTTTVYDEATKTVTGETCEETGYQGSYGDKVMEYEDDGESKGEYKNEEEEKEKPKPKYNSGHSSAGEEKEKKQGNGDWDENEENPSDDLEFMNEYCYDGNC